ncbi:MAG TPA: BamA/TamA family outer membrane protein [Vicinamibacteria bacterium]|nr:BamA/TamA family outer membrane protein [Vicinamibacteria bacterium]
MDSSRPEPGTRRGLALCLLATALGAAPASAQFIPYFGKNKVAYDNFAWRVYKSPHFEVYYYPEFEQHLSRVVSYLESSYQKVSSALKHELESPVPVVFYKTHSEFEQTNLYPTFVPEGVAAFAESVRGRMVLPIDEPPDKLQGLITHELTHIFEFDIIPRNLVQRTVPLWVDEGLADYMRGSWDPLDLMSVRDAAITDQIPRMSREEDFYYLSNPRLVYNLGHAAFEFIEARYGKEGIRQFLYTFRKNIVGGGMEDIYAQAFRIRPEEFDEAFDKWLKERFKPFRDKQRPSDYGKDLAPDSEKTSFSQVYAFSPSPSGEIVAALTGNRAEGEADLILLSARDGAIIENLTKGYTEKFENVTWNDDFVAGRTISFDPRGDTVAFFARKGKRRSLYLVSVLTGKIIKRVPMELDQAQSPALLPDSRHALLSGIKDGVSDIWLLDMETGETKNLTMDSFYDSNPQISPDGKLVVYTRRISGHDKIYVMPLSDPAKKTQLTFGTYSDTAPIFSPDGSRIYYSSTEEDEIYNIRSLDLKTGIIRQYTDALGGTMTPAVLPGRGADRVAFISYFKGEYRLQTLDTSEPFKEIEQEVGQAAEIVDFEPDVVHQVVAENKRKKRTFEKLFLEGRPPLNVGVTSSGDFFGGSQVALTDVLGDHNFMMTAVSLREFRSYEGTYLNLTRRLHWGFTAFDFTQFFYAAPYDLIPDYSRRGAFATQRYSGAVALAQYPLDKFRRLELQAGVLRVSEGFENPFAEEQARLQAQLLGLPYFLNNGSIAPISLNLVGETTRFREFGPLAGHTFSIGLQTAPSVGGLLSRHTVDVDARKYFRLGQGTVFALRARGFKSGGENPDIFYFGGNMELRGFPYRSLVGNEGFFANAELRIPLIDVMKTPLGILGPVRGTLFAGAGSAKWKGQPYDFVTRDPGISYLRDPIFGEPVSGLRLVDGRASYGMGLQFFFLGYPLHFDWIKITDLKTATPGWRFDFWIGYDF